MATQVHLTVETLDGSFEGDFGADQKLQNVIDKAFLSLDIKPAPDEKWERCSSRARSSIRSRRSGTTRSPMERPSRLPRRRAAAVAVGSPRFRGRDGQGGQSQKI